MDKRGLPGGGHGPRDRSFEELVAERNINSGRMLERPLVLVGQQYLADPPRSSGDLHPVWAYAHVPSGYDGVATGAILGQIERFAPGFRERIVTMATRTPADLAAFNSNYVGGDIIAGANTPVQVLIRPRFASTRTARGSWKHLHLLRVDSARSRRAHVG